SFGTAATEFEQVYAAFMDARQDAQQETDAKIEANNAIYADGRVMMEDGKHIFRNNASVRERFTWERILALVSTPEYGGSVERSGALAMGQIGNIDIDTVGDGVVEVAASSVGSTMRYYATDNVANGPGMIYLDVPVGTTVTRTVDDFAAVVGLNEVNRFLNVQNVGPVSGEWRVVFGK
ncbi:MAG: hypothetical protein JNK66_12610, partial [Chitinophagales bacterium]|nr:hypothetical protein [Chitinophagales bacterium]